MIVDLFLLFDNPRSLEFMKNTEQIQVIFLQSISDPFWYNNKFLDSLGKMITRSVKNVFSYQKKSKIKST